MPLTEPMAQATYSPTDEAALARLTGITEPLDATARAINSLTEQLEQVQRELKLRHLQAVYANAEAKKWRGRYDALYKRSRRAQVVVVTPEPRAPRSYAEMVRGKRF